MSLLFYEPFDGYELNNTAFVNRYGVDGGTNRNELYRNRSSLTGRPSGSIFWWRNGQITTAWFPFSNDCNETIAYIAYYPFTGATQQLRFGNTSTDELFAITFGSATTTISNPTTTVFTSTNAIQFNTWNFLEIRSVISSNSLTSGSVQLKNNGQLLFSASNINTNGNNRTPIVGVFGVDTNGGDVHVDDILVLSVTGSSFNGPIGSGNFFMTSFVPSASGFYTDMTSSGASTDANAINERPANNDTSYLIATASGPFPLRETFTLRPANTASVFTTFPTNSVINGVLKTSVVRSSLLDFGSFKHLLRTNTQDYTGSRAISASSTYTFHFDGWQVNPNTGNNFSVSEINNLQVGFIRES